MKPKQRAFLKAYAATASVTRAAKAAKLDRTMHYDWMKEAEYPAAFADAVEQAAGLLEDEAIARAAVGEFEPNVYKGQFSYPESAYIEIPNPDNPDALFKKFKLKKGAKPLGTWTKSDQLLMFLLKGLKPDKYGTRTAVELTGKDGGPIALEQKKLENLNDDELAALIAIAAKLATDGGDGSGTPPAQEE